MLRKIKHLFWNNYEKRLRTGWRMAVFACLVGILCIPIGLAIGIWMAFQMVKSGQLPETNLDPTLVAGDLINSNLYLFITILFLIVTIVSVLLAARFLDRRRIPGYGLHVGPDWWKDLAFGLALGAFLMTAIFTVEKAAGWLTVIGFWATTGKHFFGGMLSSALLFTCVGIYEELLARGYLLKNLAEGIKSPVGGSKGSLLLAWLLSSIVFGLGHLTNPGASLSSTINLILAGLFLGLGAILTGELAIPIGLHITWNFFQGSVLGFPVSGMAPGTRIISIAQGGPELWTGGIFGPEAGLIGVSAIILGSLLTLFWVRWRYGKIELASRITHYTP